MESKRGGAAARRGATLLLQRVESEQKLNSF